MAGFFQTLMRPDREDEPERAEVANAANLLQIGEFQFLQLAYENWHGRELQPAQSDEVFRLYMVQSHVPAWARHYAREIIELARRGELHDQDPNYHRYDSEYFTPIPLGARRLAWAVACISVVMVGGLLVGHFAPRSVTSVLPPYFNEKELKPATGDADARPGQLRGS